MQGSFPAPSSHSHTLSLIIIGVTDIETNVEAKSVVVTHSDAVTKEEMLTKLQKVRSFDQVLEGNFLRVTLTH